MAGEPRRTPQTHLPKRIGRYEAFLEIGAGGMARVYLAGQLGQAGGAEIVVVKVLRREAIEDEHVVALFMDEARIATRLRHPNVILTREVVAQPPDYLLAMEFQDGQSLLQVLRRLGRNAVPLDEHIWILTQVLAGLDHAHGLTDAGGRALGIVHRDVSPSNVLVCYGGEVKLLDFGIAKATGALAATQDGVVKGKLGYAAPEQCLGKPADPRSDIYAVGVMLWEAIAGRRRASGETWHSVLQARIDDAEPRLEEVCPDAPAALSAIAGRALGHEPETRYATAREFQHDLEAYIAARRAKITPARIAALIGPHFAQDREDQRNAIDAYLRGQQSHISGHRRRVPLPGPLPALSNDAPVDEEDTSRIPVDDALLLKSRRGSMSPPGSSSVPPAPVMPNAPPVPAIPKAASGAPPVPAIPKAASGAPPLPVRQRAASNAPPVAAASSAPAAPAVRQDPPGYVAEPPIAAATGSAPVVAAAPRPSGVGEGLPSAPVAAVSGIIRSSAGEGPGEPPPKRAVLPWIVGGSIAVVGGAVVGLLSLHSHSSAVASAAVRAPTGLAEPAASAAGPAPLVPSASQVRVRIAVSPPEAELRLDGLLLKGNPFTSVFPKSDTIHELSASADGYREERQAVQFIQDVDLQFSLHRGRGAPRMFGVRAAAPVVPVPVRTGTEAHVAAPAVEPGMDLKTKPDPRGKRTIDEKDPYSQ